MLQPRYINSSPEVVAVLDTSLVAFTALSCWRLMVQLAATCGLLECSDRVILRSPLSLERPAVSLYRLLRQALYETQRDTATGPIISSVLGRSRLCSALLVQYRHPLGQSAVIRRARTCTPFLTL